MADTAPTQSPKGMSGSLVGERYRLMRHIAAGGMAEVYAARDVVEDREAAVKILPDSQNGESVSRFKRESEAAAGLRHPHIVQVYDWGPYDGTHYIAMEYLPGPNLKQLIDGQGSLPEDRALEIAAQLADALDFAHRQHVIHRDVKPHNVLLDGEGNIKLADFGIARVAGSIHLTQTRSVLGTAQYLSPEQARGQPLDERTDIYSLGVVLFEMLTGQVPFQAESPVAVALKHSDEAPPRPRDINPRISPEAEVIALRAMEKSPARRYQTAAEMRDVIQVARQRIAAALNGATARITPVAAAIFGTPGVASAGPVVRSPAAWRRRSRTPAFRMLPLVVIAVILALALVGTFAFSRSLAGVAVPDVRGMTQVQAAAELEGAGLQVKVAGTLVSADVPAGTIISQQPSAGDRVDRNSAIQVALSAGRGTATVPNLVGRTEADARALLRNAGLAVGGSSQAPSDSVAAGLVLRQSPPAGREVAGYSGVDLVISSGRPTVATPPPAQQNQAPNRGRGRGRD